MKTNLLILFCLFNLLLITLIGGSYYMLTLSLAPDPNRTDVDSCYNQQFTTYPESKIWIDSLRNANAFRDTFIVMPSGEKHHAFYVFKGVERTAVIIHGWRDCAIKFLWLARIYESELGYNVILPELHACGESEGDAIQMGWKDRHDILYWIKIFQTDTMVVHGISMGAATAMMLSGDPMLPNIKNIKFIEDCGYTSVWDEFAFQLKEKFHLPTFPLLYTSNILCRLHYGWSFSEASSIEQVRKCNYPMLFIHGERDSFVPTQMAFQLYKAKIGPKKIWISKDAGHAMSYRTHKSEYVQQLRAFTRQ